VEGDQFCGTAEEDGLGVFMSASGRVFLGDLARSLAVAGSPRGDNWNEIADMLGFGREKHATPSTPATVPPVPGSPTTTTSQQALTTSGAAPTPTADIGELLEFDFDHKPAPQLSVPHSVSPIPDAVRKAPAVLQPLLDPLWQRGVLIESLGRLLPEGGIAIGAAVEAIARGEALVDVPREVVQSVSKGCQVLIDTSQGMRPFAKDARQLLAAIRRAVGSAHTQSLTFTGTPLSGVMTESYDDELYRPPDNGALVLAVSDLGAGAPGTLRKTPLTEWRKTARLIRDAGSQLIVLNPYKPQLWPPGALSIFPIVHWDRTTRASDVRRLRRRLR
jgi:hypothetical protein